MFDMNDTMTPNQNSEKIYESSFWEHAAEKLDGTYVPWSKNEQESLIDFARKVDANEAVRESIQRLGEPETLVVVAGQQVGLFLSPLYIMYKAAAAILWARRLEIWLKRPVRPVFWIASEDHDYDEIRKVHYMNAAGQIMEWQYNLDVVPGTSMFNVTCKKERIAEYLQTIRNETRETEFRDTVLERWASHAQASENLEDFFARGLMDFFGHEGLIPFSSNNMALRSRAVDILRREIENPCETSRRIKSSADDAIHRSGDEINFFIYREGKRARIRHHDGSFNVESLEDNAVIEKMHAQQILDELEKYPENFSPNVVTRPLVQDSVLPVIAMIGGPGERRYLLQLRQAGVYDALGVKPAVTLPRPRCLLIEPNVEKSIEKIGLDETTLISENKRYIREATALNSDFGKALEAVEQMESKAEALFAKLRPELGQMADNPAVSSAMEKTLAHWKKGANKMAQRVRREIEQHDAASQHHLERILNTIAPDGIPQERCLGPLAPFQLHYGTKTLAEFILKKLSIDKGADLQILRLSKIHEEQPK